MRVNYITSEKDLRKHIYFREHRFKIKPSHHDADHSHTFTCIIPYMYLILLLRIATKRFEDKF